MNEDKLITPNQYLNIISIYLSIYIYKQLYNSNIELNYSI